MPEKPFKISSLTAFRKNKIGDHARNVDKDLKELFDYLASHPRVYTQSTEPAIANDTWAFWKDSDDNKFYLVLDIAGTQKKVELT